MRLIKIFALIISLAIIGCSGSDDEEDAPKFTLKGAGLVGAELADGVDPEYLKIKVYKFAVSENKDCSDATTVYENNDPEAQDMLGSPEIGTGELAEGTYPCVILEMSSSIGYAASEDTDTCTQGEAANAIVCRSETGELADGTEVTCKETESVRVGLFLSTLSKSTSGSESEDLEECQSDEGYDEYCSTFKHPTTAKPYRGLKLGKALVVEGDTVGTFVVDGSGRISDDGDECEMGPPGFSFSYE